MIEIGNVPGSSPTKKYFRKNPEDQGKYLQSNDIIGNKPGSRRLGNFHSRERRHYGQPGQNIDIIGSVAGSLNKGIKVPEG